MKRQSTSLCYEGVERLIHDFQATGSKDLEFKIIKKYQKVVESIAWKYSKGNAYHEDIVQVGMIGLIGAIRRFDSSVGMRFKAFAIPTIVGEIKHFLRDKTWSVHVPRRVKELGVKIKKAVDDLTIQLQRNPSSHEIAEYLKIDEQEILEVLEMGQGYQAISADTPLVTDSEEKNMSLYDVVGKKEKDFERVTNRIALESVLPILDERERKVLQYTYVQSLSQKETGIRLGISQMHVSRIQRRAIKKLQKALRK